MFSSVFRLFRLLPTTLFCVAAAVLWLALPAQAEVRASDIRIGLHADKTRLVIELSERVEAKVFALQDPYRLVIDLPEIEWTVPKGKTGNGAGLIKRFRFGLFQTGTGRVVLDLTGPAEVRSQFILGPDGGKPWRLVLDLAPTSREQFAAVAIAQEEAPAAQDEAPAAQEGAPAAQEGAPAAEDEAPGEGRKEIQIRIDLLDVLAQARKAVRAGDFLRAVGLYRFILRFAPDLKVARVELSFALAALGEGERAARLLGAIDTEGLSPEVIDLIGRIVGPDKLTFFLVPQFFADSNLTGQTKDKIIFIDGRPFRLSEEARGQPGFGYGLTGGASYRLIDRDPRTTLTAGVTIRDFEQRRFDQQILFGALSFGFDLGRVGPIPRVGLIPSVSGVYRYRDWVPREAEFGAGLAVPMDLRPVRNTVGVRYRKIDGEHDNAGRLDRKVYEVYDIVSFGFAGVGFRLDARHIREDWLETNTQDNWRLVSGLDMIFANVPEVPWVPWVVPTVGASFTYRDFKNPAAFFNVERLDREYEGHIELLFRDWKVFGSRPFIRYEYTRATSNIALFDFDRQEVSFGVRVITY